MLINQRQLNIIKILKDNNTPINSIALSKELGCSTKTIQTEIKELNKQLKNSKVLSIRGAGYKIEGDFKEVDLNYEDCNDIDRVSYIIKILLNLEGKSIKLEELAESMYVSLSTVKNDLKVIKKIFEKYNISINKQHKKGIVIEGKDEDILAFKMYLLNDKSIELSLNDFIDDKTKENIFNIKHILLIILKQTKLTLSDLEFKNLLNSILITFSKHKKNSISEKKIEEFVMNYVLSYKEKRDTIMNNNENKDLIIKSIREFCKNLKLATSIDLSSDEIFERYLYDHINNLYKRIKLGINNTLLIESDIKINYPFVFELAKIAKKTIEKHLNIYINDQEIGNIAIHIGGAMQRLSDKKEDKVYKAIIVCTSGIGTSMLIKSKLENIFKDKLEILKVIPSYLVDFINVIEVDFIISTVNLELQGIPIINISPMLSDKEVRLIQKYIETEKIHKEIHIKDLLEEDLFFVDLNINTKEDVIKYMSQELFQRGYIDEKMKESFLEREKIATTEIGNMVAIPHGSGGEIYENKIVVSILKNPIEWEVGKVGLVIMLCIDKENILNYEELFLNLYKRVDSMYKVMSLCESKKYEKFKKLFN